MNIFVSDLDPEIAARNLDDKRVVKMVLETAQILCTTIGGPYKPTHKNHPCTKWAGDCAENLWWTYCHWCCLTEEYSRRFGKKHNSYLKCNPYFLIRKTGFPTSWMLCPPGVHTSDPTHEYKELLIHKWNHDKRPPRWTASSPPSWAKTRLPV